MLTYPLPLQVTLTSSAWKIKGGFWGWGESQQVTQLVPKKVGGCPHGEELDRKRREGTQAQ